VSDQPGSTAERLRNRALWSMVSAAFFSWQSAIIIALTIIFFGLGFTPFGWWQPVFWLIFGAVGLLAFVAATLTDPKAQQRILSRLLSEKYNPSDIQNDVARGRLVKALEYYSAIQSLVPTRSGASRVEFQHTLDEIDDWIGNLYELGKRVDQFDENHIINRDRMQARNELDALNRRLKAETDADVQEAIRRSIQMKETQLNNLMTIESNVKRADIQMDNTLAALGTVYAQLQLIGSKDIDRSRAQRLRNEVHDQVASLQDTIAAIDEVHGVQAR
jgi:hypothetical protein